MPIHFNDVDVTSELAGSKSALIVPCIMCPAVTVAVREKKPFMQFLRSLFKSAPFEQYLSNLQSRLGEQGIKTKVFRSYLYHHWFMCMWTSSRRKKLQKYAKQYETIIVLGCDSAAKTVRDSVDSTDCKVVEGMECGGLTNAKMKLQLPANVVFEDVEIVPMPKQ